MMRTLLRWMSWSLLALAVGVLWLRTTPYWVGITLFAESNRVENFRAMDRVFPAIDIPNDGQIWRFQTKPQPLPDSYLFEGHQYSVAAFLDQTQTTGFLVLVDDTIVHEAYRLGADERSPFTSWSVAKSMVSALIGIAIEEGAIANLDDPAARYVPALEGTDYGAVPIRDLLTMSSGIAFDEDYDSAFSDVNRLFIAFATGVSLSDVLSDLAKKREPGVYNSYISSDTIALGLVLEGATEMSLPDYMASRLWGPVGAEAPAFWNTSRAGEALPLCCMNAVLRDYARFGRLYRDGGARAGQQIIPADWVTASVTPEAAHLKPGPNAASSWSFGYGYQWWLPEEPQGDFLAIGIWGQYIYVNPARDIVIVKTSVDPLFDERDHETVAMFREIAASLGR